MRRQRIPLPDPVKYRYYDILDLNIGKEPEIYGRVYRIYNCDKFTRCFLNRMGIPVPDPFEPPNDPSRGERNVSKIIINLSLTRYGNNVFFFFFVPLARHAL